jgi:DNA sulfur modification protein DndD
LLDDKNRAVETYIAYAEYMYEKLSGIYAEKEASVRHNLEKAINEIFESIFGGDFYLTLDEKYNVRVDARTEIEFGDNVEASTSQSISVIFAFIAGIIILARAAEDGSENLISSEPYPLVMDAPLSAFDTKRIKTVCTTLPQIAEQVIIFIKDTDGILAEEHMGGKIGVRKEFRKKSTFQTEII